MAWSFRLVSGVRWFLTAVSACGMKLEWCSAIDGTLCFSVQQGSEKVRVFEVRQSSSGSQFGFWTSWRGYYPLRFIALSSHWLELQSGKEMRKRNPPSGPLLPLNGDTYLYAFSFLCAKSYSGGWMYSSQRPSLGLWCIYLCFFDNCKCRIAQKTSNVPVLCWAHVLSLAGGLSRGLGAWECFRSVLSMNSPQNGSTSHVLEISVPRKRKRSFGFSSDSYTAATSPFLGKILQCWLFLSPFNKRLPQNFSLR